MDLKPAYTKIARVLEQILKKQVPVKTGALRSSLHVVVNSATDEVDFTLQEKMYGKFLDMGTGRYRTTRRGEWNPRPGKGKGGIKPRFWKSISDKDAIRINMIIEEEISRQIEKEFK